MKIDPHLWEKISESLSSVLPITAIVLLLSVTAAPLSPGTLVLFFFGAMLLIVGTGLFTLGVDMSMMAMGEGIGVEMSLSKGFLPAAIVAFVLGALATVAEPDLQVLAGQVPAIPNLTLIVTVALGVGLFLAAAVLRILLHVSLPRLLLVFYALAFLLAAFAPANFIPLSFDAGGVTTGPITVPFIMAMGIGITSVRSDKNASSDSFGLISLSSIGPVLAVLLLGICFQPEGATYTPSPLLEVETTRQAALAFTATLPHYGKEVLTALAPVCAVFALFQCKTRRFKGTELLRIFSGLVYTLVGLVIFLTGVNVGFMPAGQYLGATIAASGHPWLLVPIGMLMGYFIVAAEPAVHVLNKQVEEVSHGSITQATMRRCLSAGVALSVGIAMLRVLTGISILWFLIPGYAISLGMTFFVPDLFTGVAFDSGGVASGPMTATFLLPFAMGACEAIGGDLMTDAFGLVAMVAMTPLLTIQLLGLVSRLRREISSRVLVSQLERVEDCVLYFDEEDAA